MIAMICTQVYVRECSLFIPRVGTEEKLIEKRKKQSPNHYMAWISILPNPVLNYILHAHMQSIYCV